ncbi:allophanate hydrolase [Aspergillus luchuensis IFO 4308]|nr:allophanate hydrolase [Aspergillus luchuensis IFO 4308]
MPKFDAIIEQWNYITSCRAQGKELPLFGVPFAVKDNIAAAGFFTTAACPSFGTERATADSTVVSLLKEQGAIVVGKTNLDQFATGLSGTRSPYGAVVNAFDSKRVSGGSSSGSAVVVSQGLVPFALGTDTAGSGRVPAVFNNVIGLKPTRPEWFGCSEQASAYAAALVKAQRLGWKLESVDFAPLFKLAGLLYEGPWVAERYAAIERFIHSEAAEAMDPVVRAIILKAEQFSAVDVFQQEYYRQELSRQIEHAFGTFDAVLVPTTPTFPTVETLKEAPILANSRLGTYTNFVNFMGWSAVAIPADFREDGLPFAHLSGFPLNKGLVSRGAVLGSITRTASCYQLFALQTNSSVQKPGLKRVVDGGESIKVEVWNMPLKTVGSFLSTIEAPLGIGSIELQDGSWVHGFICEPNGLDNAKDITSFRGWRGFMQSLSYSTKPSL